MAASKTTKANKSKPITESKFQQHLVAFLKRHDILYYKTHGGQIHNGQGFYQMQSGFPDIQVIADHRVIFIELKREKRYLRPKQIETFNRLKQEIGDDNLFVFYSDQWENFKKVFKETKSIYKTLSITAKRYHEGMK